MKIRSLSYSPLTLVSSWATDGLGSSHQPVLVASLDNFAFQIVERQQLKLEQLHSQVQVSRSLGPGG